MSESRDVIKKKIEDELAVFKSSTRNRYGTRAAKAAKSSTNNKPSAADNNNKPSATKNKEDTALSTSNQAPTTNNEERKSIPRAVKSNALSLATTNNSSKTNVIGTTNTKRKLKSSTTSQKKKPANARSSTSSASSTSVVLRRSLNSEVVRLFPHGEVDKEEESDAAAWDSDSEIAEESDEENSRPTIVNTAGKVVDKALSEAQIKSNALGRGAKWLRANKIRVEGGFGFTQVLPRLPHVNAVKISVIEMTLKNPSRKYPEKTITLLVQVPPGTHDARSLVCFEMSYMERTFDTLTAKPKKGKALFNFNHSIARKATQIADRLKNSLGFKAVLSMERNAAGNKGYHDLNKEVYSEDMVWLFGHRLLEVDEQGNLVTDNLGLIHNNTNDNPAWSFTDLPRC